MFNPLFNLIKNYIISCGLGIVYDDDIANGESIQISENNIGLIEVKRKIETNSKTLNYLIKKLSCLKLDY